ncbi:lipoprotein-releasing system ATP-binding protein [Algoriphagus aquaeductus]|uniref:Lipoprotein-releasing system ATP-binding protein n=1 Tax=Algoriphagus aquaeductus TaxID=475299 RepID=A0A326RZI5_9BACT|nr:ABC transporter ATP-binding protein [Algoriphagus aquaeductus]PZV87213.1 lipoprotein-releasing system ATP-binding protein [Algoriphagus aquaeductus]
MSTSNILLKTQGIIKYFHDPETFQVLKGIDIEVHKGEFLSLIGKSGSGKSTLLYLLSTMDMDFEGKLVINGEELTGKSPDYLARFRSEHIGFVFQFHFLLPEFTALENVMIPALKLGKYSEEVIRQKAMEKLDLLGIADQAKKASSRLSGGQQQRVAIARALINDPLLIMGDEPTGNLDSVNSKIVFDTFRKLTRDLGQTIITVTHDDDFAAKTDRIIEMKDGKIIS